MQEQIYALTIVHAREKNVGTEDLRSWLREALNKKVDRYIGLTAESFGGSTCDSIMTCSLRILHSDNISAETMKSYLANTPEAFQITQISKR